MSKKANYFLGMVSGLALAVIAWVAFMPIDFQFLPTSAPRQQQAAADGLNTEEVSQKLSHIYRIINHNFIGDFDLETALDVMFAGFVYGAGDPYTVYLSSDAFVAFRENTQGEFVGIGVSIATDPADGRILVVSPFEGSPAFGAGVLPGDKIIRVDGVEVFGNERTQEAIGMMRGERGTPVTITVLRESEDITLDITIVRDIIQVETVRHRVIEDTNIGYLRISQFDRVTYDQFINAYEDLMGQNIEGLIIDVRNNPGGLLDVVNSIADVLVPEGIITYTEDARGRRTNAYSDARQIEIPLVVLVNGNSASASEILSGAVRDTGVGELLGTTTFGKGLVQNVFPLPCGAAVKVTIARYFTPAGICINGEGIVPTHYVEMPAELTNRLSTLEQEYDVQLLEAINLMEELMGN
ncbi:MAG: S41 family peptidase [Defluviitaleaceae bacterium]|nr:S41 family peptidase [Defluviitaleaceae bacterium]